MNKPAKPHTEGIFGTSLEVKKLYVRELREQLEKNGLSPEQFDEIMTSLSEGFLDRWPTARSILEDPDKFTPDYNQALGWITLFGGPRGIGDERVSQLSGTHVSAKLMEFLADPERLETILRDFHSKGYIAHVTIYPEEAKDPNSVPRGELTREGSPNHIPKIVLAEIHLHQMILNEMRS